MSIEELAHLAEITIVVLPHGGQYKAEQVNELLARQRQMIADRYRKLGISGNFTMEADRAGS